MELTQAIAGRRAVRSYRPEAVDPAVVRRVVEAAVQAPSAVNEQPWLFTVVRDRALLEELSVRAKRYMLSEMGASVHSPMLLDRLADPNYQIFHDAPALVLIAAATEGPWATEDCALAAANLMLAAYGEGLGSCWIGFAQPYIDSPGGRELLGLSPDCVPVAPIVVGYPTEWPAPVARKAPMMRWVG